MASPYNSNKTGQEVDAAADLAKNFVVGIPSSDQVLAWRPENGEYKFRPVSLATLFQGVQLYTDSIKFSSPTDNNSDLSGEQPLTNIINAVNGKLTSNGDGSQVKVTSAISVIANAPYFTYNTEYPLGEIVNTLIQKQGYFYKEQYSGTSARIPTAPGRSIVLPSDNNNIKIKTIYLYLKDIKRDTNITSNSLLFLNLVDNNNTTISFQNILTCTNAPQTGCIKIEYTGYEWLVTTMFNTSTFEGTYEVSPKIFYNYPPSDYTGKLKRVSLVSSQGTTTASYIRVSIEYML